MTGWQHPIQMDWQMVEGGFALAEYTEQLIIDRFAENHWVVLDSFCTPEGVNAIQAEIERLVATNELKPAGIGKKSEEARVSEIRGDFIHWIGDQVSHVETSNFLQKVAVLVSLLNRNFYFGIKDVESHYAVYPEGSFYLKHSDRFKTQAHRIVSLAAYFNTGWKDGDGGELVIYNHVNDAPMKIAPLAGRLVLFESDTLHEVLPTKVKRMSITAWMLDQIPSLQFL